MNVKFKMMLSVLGGCSLLGLTSNLAAATQTGAGSAVDLAAIQTRLKLPAILRCEFRQQRQLAGFKQTMQATGFMVLTQKQGIIWQQQQPFAQTIVLTPTALKQSINGQVQVIEAQKQADLFYFVTTLSQVMAGDFNRLKQSFTVLDGRHSSAAWQLGLQPKQAPLNKVFQRIDLNGRQLIDSVRLQDAQGGHTQLSFSQCQPYVLSAADKQTLAP